MASIRSLLPGPTPLVSATNYLIIFHPRIYTYNLFFFHLCASSIGFLCMSSPGLKSGGAELAGGKGKGGGMPWWRKAAWNWEVWIEFPLCTLKERGRGDEWAKSSKKISWACVAWFTNRNVWPSCSNSQMPLIIKLIKRQRENDYYCNCCW